MKPEEYIRNEVESRGMKIKFLSEKAKVAYGCLQPSLNGTRSLRADEYLRICDFLQIEPRVPSENANGFMIASRCMGSTYFVAFSSGSNPRASRYTITWNDDGITFSGSSVSQIGDAKYYISA